MSSVKRAFQVLNLLAVRAPLGVRAVAQQLNLPLGSTHRILIDLEAESVVERTPAGDWELSFRLLEITGFQIERIQIPQIARPMLERLAETSEESVHLSAPSGAETVCLDKAQTNFRLQLSTRIGSHGPMYCTGSGKALLAFLPEGEREDLSAAQPFRAVTPHTITSLSALRRELQRTRERGYSLDHEEAVLGVHCVGVPILNRFGRPVAAISISGASPKAAGPQLERLVQALQDAAAYVSRRLGHAGQHGEAATSGKAKPERKGSVAVRMREKEDTFR
jgi:DNA-binding IclR family transcriptional regulator